MIESAEVLIHGMVFRDGARLLVVVHDGSRLAVLVGTPMAGKRRLQCHSFESDTRNASFAIHIKSESSGAIPRYFASARTSSSVGS